MRLIFYGELEKLVGPEVTMQSETVGEALEGFSRQHPAWPKEMRVAVLGFDTEDKFKDHADEVHIMPAMAGGGGKFGSIILGAALVAAAFIPGVGALAVGLKASLIISGSLMIAQGTMGLFMKSPKLDKNADPEVSNYFGVNKNTTAIGTPIIMAWGRIRIVPHWLSLQSDSTNLTYGTFPANPS